MNFRDLMMDHINLPRVYTSTQYESQSISSKMSKRFLNFKEYFGTFQEDMLHIWDRDILLHIQEDLLHKSHEQPSFINRNTIKLFELFYMTVLHYHHMYGKYIIRDSANILSNKTLWNQLVNTQALAKSKMGPLESLSYFICSSDWETIKLISETVTENGISFFQPRFSGCFQRQQHFMDLATSIFLSSYDKNGVYFPTTTNLRLTKDDSSRNSMASSETGNVYLPIERQSDGSLDSSNSLNSVTVDIGDLALIIPTYIGHILQVKKLLRLVELKKIDVYH
jgi:hypothetical protein